MNLSEGLLISFMLQLFGLVSPFFFQVVMDKVLVHKGMTTLDVPVIGLVIVVVFRSVDAEDHARIHIVTEPKRDSTGHQQHIDRGGGIAWQSAAKGRAAWVTAGC